MQKRYFFAIKYLPLNVDQCLLAGRCISILHGFISARNITGIGVSFPNWSDKSLGNTIAFVSEHESLLAELSEQSYFNMMASDNLFAVSEVTSIPENLSEVRFKRNQSIAKCFVGEKRRRLERAKRRAHSRGEMFNPKTPEPEKEIQPFHCALSSSKSSNEAFLLHIQKVNTVSVKSNDYGNYGLATNQKHLGTVPDLSNTEIPYL
ncbi:MULTISPECIES: type I-F CRISPR-associated endoribonuclease Cas6/Csy4 [unclassified Pseudoalteromonas]|uniref:type I-F CRISPR-associated endoribonuclease Cas6/Csy4 n=1 Tax=unclassified Pseudoalteromonas TaxID=194690 RepID=UPI0005A8A542|nr:MULTISPECIES: type I-F CRISPR-associated endoribonuclease Cas6/Csy4 [unclassified Pseudoalteromonas]